jgi:hypothetical protein
VNFDWTAIGTVGSALATVVVASVTAWLAWQTRALARETKLDVEAQWMPLLLPPTRGGVTEESDNLHLTLVNSGRGPALRGFVWTEGESEPVARGSYHVAAGERCDPVKTPMPPDGVSVDTAARVHVEWEDLTGNIFEAVILVGRDGRGLLTTSVITLVKHKACRDAYNMETMIV